MAATLNDQVRSLIGDLDNDNPIFTSAQLDIYVELGMNNPFFAAAFALRAIAVSEALMFRYLRTDDLTVNGVPGAEYLRKQANELVRQGQMFDANTQEAFFITYPWPPFGFYELEETRCQW